ncbi:MAG: LPS export ABC transporter permease LptG [Burkholderiales bacterium]|nr:LPS export ABC transporter permease LptG [Burkholderiales bacterium]
MILLRKYLAREIYLATLLVLVAFLMLFAFFDLINELNYLGKGNYRLQHVLLFVLLSLPGHVYELAPIAVLIGTLYALSQLAANSEYTVMRISGLSPYAAGAALARIGAIFVVLTFVFGELVTPFAERAAQQLRLAAMSAVVAQEFRSGLWVTDDFRFINVREVKPDNSLNGIKIYEFDKDYRLRSISFAERGEFKKNNTWSLSRVVRTSFDSSGTSVSKFAQTDWHSVLTPDLLSVLLVQPEKMSAINLYQFTRHLSENRQQTERYEIAMWKKLLYPFATLVMMALALPFAYVHVRLGGVGVKIFSGIMLGVLFHLLNGLSSSVGIIQGWTPFYSAVLPSVMFLTAAIAMMWWVERR